ncbi:hypothetical protein VPH35_130233 [Triticum aestivum]
MSEHNCTVFNWNVRGLNNPAWRLIVRDLVCQNRASIVCLQETKLAVVDRAVILETLGPLFAYSFCFLPAAGIRGGIILAFNSDFFSIQSTFNILNTIYATISMRASVASWCIIKQICPRGNNKVVIYIFLYHDKCLLFMLELY